MGEIRIVGPGKTRGYPYPVCKKTIIICIRLSIHTAEEIINNWIDAAVEKHCPVSK